MSIVLRFGCGLLVAAAIAPGQEQKRLTARELFYTPVTETRPAAAPKKSTSTPVAKEEPARAAATKPQPKPPRSSTTPVRDPGEPAYRASEKAAKDGVEPAVVRVSTETEIVGPPLALRYSLLRMNADGEYVEVDPETVFRSGDKIKVAVESNDTGYLYIAHQGSSSSWMPLFPNQDTEAGDNRVRRNRRYVVPGTGRFYFDEQPGNERIMIVLTREPVTDLEKLIYDLNKGSRAPSPARTPAANTAPKLLIASNGIDNSVVDRVRSQMLSRDLVYERVTEDKAKTSGRSEKAMYVAVPDQTAKARLVVDLNLKHQ